MKYTSAFFTRNTWVRTHHGDSFRFQFWYSISVNIPLAETVPVSPRKNSNNQVRYENESLPPPPVSDDLSPRSQAGDEFVSLFCWTGSLSMFFTCSDARNLLLLYVRPMPWVIDDRNISIWKVCNYILWETSRRLNRFKKKKNLSHMQTQLKSATINDQRAVILKVERNICKTGLLFEHACWQELDILLIYAVALYALIRWVRAVCSCK